ncbi:hypothetical protein ACU4HD_46265 [Cupriavidus basilensis]
MPADSRVTASADLQGPVVVILDRQMLAPKPCTCVRAQVRTVAYTGTLLEVRCAARLRIDVPDLDAGTRSW